MPVTTSYPGVYIEELPSGVHPIIGVATSITAFVGFAQRGPVNEPTLVQSFGEFSRTFGGLWAESTMSQAVNLFFRNGGGQALIVRVVQLSAATKGTLALPAAGGSVDLEAIDEGAWSASLRVRVDLGTADPTSLFNLWIQDASTHQVEVLRNLPVGAAAIAMVAMQSSLIRMTNTPPGLPDAPASPHEKVQPGEDPFHDSTLSTPFGAGLDGDEQESYIFPASDDGTGIYALARADLFNLLCIPPVSSDPTAADGHLSTTAISAALTFCKSHRAMFILDSDSEWTSATDAGGGLDTYLGTLDTDASSYGALYFPYLRAPDPLQKNLVVDFPPCGAVAGVFARTDSTRGVWKAPAGIDAGLTGIQELKVKVTDGENGTLNPVAVNCLRTFPSIGSVVWGARTLAGKDILANQWKYVPVRRTALYIEESLFRGTQWVVFEPNDERLWAQIRLNVGAFMQTLFRQGAFQGTTPREAYLVKCDSDTTTQTDINNGVVNILVGFAPLKPAEFVIIQIQQLAGQIET